MPNMRKKQTLLKPVMHFFKYHIVYSLSRTFECKKALFYVTKGLFQFKRIISLSRRDDPLSGKNIKKMLLSR